MSVVAICIILAWIFGVVYSFIGEVKHHQVSLVSRSLGIVEGAMLMIVSYFFGSSADLNK